MSAESPISVFIAYSREDVTFLNELKKHIKPLERNKLIDVWFDGEINPGNIWEQEIKSNLHKSDIILLLVSANSIASDYFYDKELEDSLERHKKGEAIVLPIILKTCSWKDTPIGILQALPKDGKPINTWDDDSKAFYEISEAIKNCATEVIKKRKSALQDSGYISGVEKDDEKNNDVIPEIIDNRRRKIIISITKVILIGLAIFLGTKFFTQKKGDKGPAEITISNKEFYVGRIREGSKAIHEYDFINTGEQVLIISAVKTSCGCLVAEWPSHAIYPGSGGKIKVTYDSRNRGKEGGKKYSHKVNIQANTKPANTTLVFSAQVYK